MTIINTILSSQSAHAVYEESAAADATLRNCLFFNNPDGDLFDFETGSHTGAAEIMAHVPEATNLYDGDPMLDAGYHLLDGSAALDRGTSVGAPATDFEGDPRPGADGLVDIGADEAPPEYEPTGNHPPVAVADFYVAIAGALLEVPAPGVLGNDTDPDGDALAAVLIAGPASGTLTLNPDGSFTYAPNGGVVGGDAFTYAAFDGRRHSAPAAVMIAIVPPSDAAARDDAFTVRQNGSIVVGAPGVLGNDADPQGEALAAALASGPGSGTLTLDPDGAFAYTPAAGVLGTDAFTYRAVDPRGAPSNVATVRLRITAAGNRAPSPAADFFTVSSNTLFTMAAPGVLGNDRDPDGDTMLARLTSPPTSGSLALHADGSFTYLPLPGFTGTDRFYYRAYDGAQSAQAAVTLRVVAAGVRSPIGAADVYSGKVGGAIVLAWPGVLANDRDPNGDTILAVPASPPSHGLLTLGADGSFTYLPASGFLGTDAFTYRPYDGALGNVTTVTLRITTAGSGRPIGRADQYTAKAGAAFVLAAPGVLVNDADPDGDTLMARLSTLPANGVLTFNWDGSFTYTPNPGFLGTDTFTYRAYDGAHSAPATVSIRVTASGGTRPVGAPDAYSVITGRVLTATAPGVLANDSDADSDTLMARLSTLPANGVLVFNWDGAFTYAPRAGFIGTDSFTYRAYDGAHSAPVTVTIAVLSDVNDPPVAANDRFNAVAGLPLTVAPPGVLANDTDPNGDPLAAVLIGGPASGTLALAANGSFTYTPRADLRTTDTFTYCAWDGRAYSNVATVAIGITPPATVVPVTRPDLYTVRKDTALPVARPGVLANDRDPNGDPLRAALVAGVGHGNLTFASDGSFTYVPAAGFTGTDTFRYNANDGLYLSNVSTVTLRVTEAGNTRPLAAADRYTARAGTAFPLAAPGVLANDGDPDGDTIMARLSVGPTNGTLVLNGDGSFTYTPRAGFTGTDSFTYRAYDGAHSAPATVAIRVTAAGNTPPVGATDAYSVIAGSALNVSAPGVLANDSDPDGDTLMARLQTFPANGTLVFDWNGGFVYQPRMGFTGTDTFVYKAYDGMHSPAVTVSIQVTGGANNPPVARNDSYSVFEAGTLDVAAPGVLANDTDADGDPLSAALVAGPANGTLTFNADGSFRYRPTAGFTGSDAFTYHVTDGQTWSSAATVTIAVNLSPDAPVAARDQYTVKKDVAFFLAAPGVLANDTEPNGERMTAVLAQPVGHGTLVFGADGSFTYTPAPGFTGTDAFLYRASDGAHLSAVTTVTLRVTVEGNTKPSAAADSFSVSAGNTLRVPRPGVLANDTDANGDTIMARLSTLPGHGTLVFNWDGSFTYTPNPGYTGADSFTYKAYDGVHSTAAAVALSVAP
jgi:hypothetical protein